MGVYWKECFLLGGTSKFSAGGGDFPHHPHRETLDIYKYTYLHTLMWTLHKFPQIPEKFSLGKFKKTDWINFMHQTNNANIGVYKTS